MVTFGASIASSTIYHRFFSVALTVSHNFERQPTEPIVKKSCRILHQFNGNVLNSTGQNRDKIAEHLRGTRFSSTHTQKRRGETDVQNNGAVLLVFQCMCVSNFLKGRERGNAKSYLEGELLYSPIDKSAKHTYTHSRTHIPLSVTRRTIFQRHTCPRAWPTRLTHKRSPGHSRIRF